MRQLITELAHPAFGIFVLLFFVSLFAYLVYRTFRHLDRAEIERRAHLPFDEEPRHDR